MPMATSDHFMLHRIGHATKQTVVDHNINGNALNREPCALPSHRHTAAAYVSIRSMKLLTCG